MIAIQLNPKPSILRSTLATLVALLALALTMPDADARRLGGGRGLGRQAPTTQPHAQPPARDAQAAPAQPGSAQKPGAAPNRWLGPLGGLAAGLGLAALLSYLGLTGPLAELLA